MKLRTSLLRILFISRSENVWIDSSGAGHESYERRFGAGETEV